MVTSGGRGKFSNDNSQIRKSKTISHKLKLIKALVYWVSEISKKIRDSIWTEAYLQANKL